MKNKIKPYSTEGEDKEYVTTSQDLSDAMSNAYISLVESRDVLERISPEELKIAYNARMNNGLVQTITGTANSFFSTFIESANDHIESRSFKYTADKYDGNLFKRIVTLLMEKLDPVGLVKAYGSFYFFGNDVKKQLMSDFKDAMEEFWLTKDSKQLPSLLEGGCALVVYKTLKDISGDVLRSFYQDNQDSFISFFTISHFYFLRTDLYDSDNFKKIVAILVTELGKDEAAVLNSIVIERFHGWHFPSEEVIQDYKVSLEGDELPFLEMGSSSVVEKKGSSVLLCIDASMDPNYLQLQNKKFLEFGNNLNSIWQEYNALPNKYLAIEDRSTSSNILDHASIGLFTQQAIEYSPTIRYFFKIIDIDLPYIYLPNELWAGIHLTALTVKTGSNSFLNIGNILESSSYYATISVYDMLAEQPTDNQVKDLISFTKVCAKHIAVGGILGFTSGSSAYGAINGAAMCLNQHQMLEKYEAHINLRYSINIITGINSIYELANESILTQIIGVISAVSIVDIVAKVSVEIVEVGMNGICDLFEVCNYNDI